MIGKQRERSIRRKRFEVVGEFYGQAYRKTVGIFFGNWQSKKKKEKEAAKPDPDADYVGDDEDYGYSEEFEDDDVDFIADEEDNEPV